MGRRQTRSRAAVSRNGAGVRICWHVGYVGSVASQIQREKKKRDLETLPSSCLAKKKKKGRLKNERQYRECAPGRRYTAAGLL